ncbi:MAG: twin-arginine translocase TatA/TatE family subunit [Firmicutes bacterium]|jgi:sec-independent protein translocase protein TatA|nr:twin-arginine translocase TatA/TatE family subunit [Bacillota bacterium]
MLGVIFADIFGVDGIIVLVVLVLVLFFGADKLPKLARGLGTASHEFKKGISEGESKTKDQSGEEGKDQN